MPFPSNVIINADDFGYNTTKNRAITKCFLEGIINSASVMTNMSTFPEAIEWSKENGFQDKIGLHVCLSEGKPLTDLSGTGLIDPNGFFNKSHIYKLFVFPIFKFQKLIKKEIVAQLNMLYYNEIIPTHINSHHHIHTLPWLAPVFMEIAKEFNLKIRIAQTWNTSKNPLVPFYRYLLNRAYKRKKINFSDYFETINSSQQKIDKIKKTSLIEVMVHPDLNSKNEVYDCVDNVLI